MNTIYKYPLHVADIQEVKLPAGATPLTVEVQHGSLCLWAFVDTNASLETRTIYMYGTGHKVSHRIEEMAFLGTVQMAGGNLVFHLFCD